MSTEKSFLQSGAQVKRPASSTVARIMGYENPEDVLAEYLKPYLEEIGFSSMFPKFKSVRVGSVHPFALFLYSQVGGDVNLNNLFPSITISDTSENDGSLDTLGHERYHTTLSRETWEHFKYYRNNNMGIWISDENVANIDAAFGVIDPLPVVELRYQEAHNIDFSIWADNDNISSFLFDVVKRFLKEKAVQLQNDKGYVLTGNVSGRRSGDINVDFGRLLYGANVSASMNVPQSGLEIDVTVGTIEKVNVQGARFQTP